MSDLTFINNQELWFSRLKKYNIIKNKKLLNYIKETVYFLGEKLKYDRNHYKFEEFTVSVFNENIKFQFYPELKRVSFLNIFIFILVTTIFLGHYTHYFFVLFIFGIFIIVRHFKYTLICGKDCTFYFDLKKVKSISKNKILRIFKILRRLSFSYKDFEIPFNEIKSIFLIKRLNQYRGFSHYWITIEKFSGEKYLLGYIKNKEFAKNTINFLNAEVFKKV